MKASYICAAAAVIATALLGFACGLHAADSTVPGQQSRRLDTTIQETVSMRYLLFLPEGYDPAGEKKWPLMIFLHGAGERGDSLERVTRHGPPKRVQTHRNFPFVLVSPQCPEGERWEVRHLEALLESVLKEQAVDPKRVYLTGLSMGGYGTWAWASAHPERFAAIAPICGGGEPIRVWLSGGARREALARLPVWAFHGAKDSVVPLAESERMVDAFKRVGNQTARLTVYPEADHDSWTVTYDNPELYDWFLRHRAP
jgi:predicted peptidase